MRSYLKTIDDLERLYYSKEGAKFIQKSDAPVLSTTTGFYNPNYGSEVWRQLNQADTAFGLIPKVPWARTGWRVITTRGAAIPTGGLAENAALPETIKPTLATISTKPKEVAHNFDISTRQELLAKVRDDDSIGDLEYLKAYFGIEHKEHIDSMLLTDVDTLAGYNFESIDRVCSSYSEVNAGLCTAGDSDIYGLDRDAGATWADAYVNHNSGTDRSISDTLIRTTFSNIFANGGKTSFMLTGFDMNSDIQGLYGDQARYNNPMSTMKIRATVNGVETVEGTEVGMNVATIYGVPIFQDPHIAKDTKSRIYFLDTSNPENFENARLHFAVLQPTSYYETRDMFAINKLGYDGMYLTTGELRCKFFAAQGKIRDLQ